MKRMLVIVAFILSSLTLTVPAVQAHTIGGAYATLISCAWGKLDSQYGYIGTYNVNGQTITQFFGNSRCPF